MHGQINKITESSDEIMENSPKKCQPMNRLTPKSITEIAMFAAVMAVLSQISIPLPSGLPVTMQTFAVALTGVVLGWKYAFASTAVYILLGLVGIPVFAGFTGGAQILFNYSGGFIWGFLFMATLCGIGSVMKNKYLGAFACLAGLAVCHIFGVIQFMVVMEMGLTEAFALASAPYLAKDVISVILGFLIGQQIRKRLLKERLL